jgi:hypothetical protein
MVENCYKLENGDKVYYLKDDLHRKDGPAVISNDGSKYWYQHGKLHRMDGPAIEFANGDNYWFLYGKEIIPNQFERLIKLKAFW